jgi:hypothetical protein
MLCVTLLLACALLASCQCNQRPADVGVDTDADANGDANADSDIDIDIDIDIVGDPDVEGDAEPDAEVPGLCDGAGPAWSWPPCNDEPNPPDCCSSCRRLTCRDMVTTASGCADIWGDLVVFGHTGNIAMVDLRTGEDSLVFESRTFIYLEPAISSRYTVARSLYREPEGYREAIVARRLDDLSGPEIVVEDRGFDRHTYVAIYDEWAVWKLLPVGEEPVLILHNIETGEQRVLDQYRSGHGAHAPGIWGDRVVWGQYDEVKGETLVEHRISTNTTRDVLTDPALEPMYSVSVWENYAVFNHQPYFSDWNAMLVDLDTGEVRQITPSGSNQDQARINGGRVIWTDFRGSSGGGPPGMHIYVYSLRTGREYVVNPSARGSSEPLIFGQNVVWGGDWEGYNGPPWVTRIGDI